MIQQPQQRERDGALSGSALAHQPQDLAYTDLQLDIAQNCRLVWVIDREAGLEKLGSSLAD